jgi:hypothetical protein
MHFFRIYQIIIISMLYHSPPEPGYHLSGIFLYYKCLLLHLKSDMPHRHVVSCIIRTLVNLIITARMCAGFFTRSASVAKLSERHAPNMPHPNTHGRTCPRTPNPERGLFYVNCHSKFESVHQNLIIVPNVYKYFIVATIEMHCTQQLWCEEISLD